MTTSNRCRSASRAASSRSIFGVSPSIHFPSAISVPLRSPVQPANAGGLLAFLQPARHLARLGEELLDLLAFELQALGHIDRHEMVHRIEFLADPALEFMMKLLPD